MAIFCFWRGFIAIKAKKFTWRGKSFNSWGTSKGIAAVIPGVLLIIFGLIIIYMEIKKFS